MPDFSFSTIAVKKMREILEDGIKIYTISGSHDFSISGSSLYNILDAAGIIMDVHRERTDGNEIYLEPVKDEKTGALLYGMYGRRMGLESQNFRKLRIKYTDDGFSIFLFHSAISELIPDVQFHMPEIPLDYLPKNMKYYAGGHIHRRIEKKIGDYSIFYPGPLFASNYQDLESMANGERRGFFIVDFSDGIDKVEFIENPAPSPVLLEINADGKIPEEVMDEAIYLMENHDLKDKYLLLKIYGELSSGKTSEINRRRIIENARRYGVAGINININSLRSREYGNVEVVEDNVRDVEKKVFEKFMENWRTREEMLNGESGINMAISLLDVLRNAKNDDETKNDFEERILGESKKIFHEDEWQ